MKLPSSLLTLVGLALFLPTNAPAQLFHFKATALFPVQEEMLDPNPHAPAGSTIVKKFTLGSKEMINLALGRALDTKIDSDVVLALAVDVDLDPDHGKLVVYNKHLLTTLATVLTLIDPLSTNAASKDGEKGSGNGLSRGTITATSGAPANGFLASTVAGAATASKTPTEHGPNLKMSMTSIVGPFKANIEGVAFDGLIIKGMFSASGKPLDF